MIGGLLKTTSLAALALAGGLMATQANAADLGGNCCTDLEERVAELEATTARKGNRKVSLTVYGTITQSVMFWDDGAERNAYVSELDTNKNIIGFRGNAKIDAEWSAGYRLEYQALAANSAAVNQIPNGDEGNTGTTSLSLRHAALYVQSSRLGTVWVGQSDTASSGITTIDLSNSGVASSSADTSAFGAGFFIRNSAGPKGDAGLSAITWADLQTSWGGATNSTSLSRRNVVRYITPTVAGFALSTSWGEDDTWDVALRYAGEHAGFRIGAGIAYANSMDRTAKCRNVGADGYDCHSLGGSASVMHVATGLFLNGSYAKTSDDVTNSDSTHWSVTGGIEQKWVALGKTTLFGYYMNSDLDNPSRSGNAISATSFLDGTGVALTGSVRNADYSAWGVGLVQNVEAAALDLFITYVHQDVDVTSTTGGKAATDAWQSVITGASIKF